MRDLKIGAVVLAILFAGVLLVLAVKWPFTREATIRSLEQISLTEVQIPRFRKVFFLHPGYVAEDVTFRRDHGPGARPLLQVARITCRASWFSLLSFTHRIHRIDLEGVQIYIPAPVPPPVRRHPQAKIATTVTDLYANGTILEIAPRHPGGQTIRFEFPELSASNLARNKPMYFRTLVRNPIPPGDLAVSGTVGPLVLGKISDTQISGAFHIRNANLGAYKLISGTLSSDGQFSGKLGRAQVTGRTDIPDFEVTRSGHPLGLTAEYHAEVNGTTGDVIVQSALAHFLNTVLTAHGTISGRPGKTVSLDFGARQARIQDLLRLFVKADQPPLDGEMTLRAHVVLPPSPAPFLQRVQLNGDFSITGAAFTNPVTQEKIDDLSARARAKKHDAKLKQASERVAAELEGKVILRHEIATLTEAAFAVPGAVAQGSGTYNLASEAVDMRGKLAMRASLSQAAGGIKSLLLMPLDPFFRKNGAGAVLPVHMSGTYAHPIFRMSLHQ